MNCTEFKAIRAPDSQFYKDSCLKCGKTEAAHCALVIYYQDKILRFKDWAEARKAGFYPG